MHTSNFRLAFAATITLLIGLAHAQEPDAVTDAISAKKITVLSSEGDASVWSQEYSSFLYEILSAEVGEGHSVRVAFEYMGLSYLASGAEPSQIIESLGEKQRRDTAVLYSRARQYSMLFLATPR